MSLRFSCRLVCGLVFAAGLAAGPFGAGAEEEKVSLTVSYPPPRTLVSSYDLVVEGYVQTRGVDEVEIQVNNGRPVRALVRDTVFAEEVRLDDGRNLIRVGSEVREVWLASSGTPVPDGYKAVYGHIGLDEGCLECHEVGEDGTFTLAGEREEICGWCHGDIVRGSASAPWVSAHAPVREGRCLECHAPHLSEKRGLPAAEPATCGSCHAGVVDRLQTDRFVHGPMNLGDCRLCHAVHGSPEPRLLVRPATALCTDCHSDLRPPPETDARLRPHPMIPEGQCGRCHEPHSSANQRMLRQAAGRLCQVCHEGKTRSFHEAKGFSIYVCARCHDLHRPTQPHLIIDASRSLCTECHDYSGKALFTHTFVTDGRCFLCHSFHESALPREIAEICLACHRDNPRLSTAHHGLPIDRSRCTSCHRPHQAQRAKLLRAVEHTPFARGECDVCHRDRAGMIGPAASALCLDCHRGKDLAARETAPAYVHQPFREKTCADCHRTHNSNEAGLLDQPQGSLCLGCHRTMRKATLLTPVSAHTAVTAGRCGVCHDPHFSDNESFLRRPGAEFCPSCHAALTRAPDGGAWPVEHKPVAEGKCRLCHKPHTSSNPALLKAPSPRACRPCHVPFFTNVESQSNRSVHAPVKDGACGTCHQVHGGPARLLAPGGYRERCLDCHKELKNAHHRILPERVAESGGRAAVDRGCLLCHEPHASSLERLLPVNQAPCKACHKT